MTQLVAPRRRRPPTAAPDSAATRAWWVTALAPLYRAGLLLGVPAAWLGLASAGWVESLAWLPALLALALAPVAWLQARKLDPIAIGLALVSAVGIALLPAGPAIWVGLIGTGAAFAITTPVFVFVLELISATLGG